jgi:hypothetical protein
MRGQNTDIFDELYQPVVCVLGAAKEAVSPGQIAEWTKFDVNQVLRVLGDWREFLYEERKMNEPAFRIYHGSFREFLQEEVDPGLRNYHRLIAQSALAKVKKAKGSSLPAEESSAS